MPDYCFNKLTIKKGDIDALFNKKGDFDFNQILPMPESLHIESGSSNDEDLYVYLSDKLKKPLNKVRKSSTYLKICEILLENVHYISFTDNDMASIYERVCASVKGSHSNIDEMYERGKIIASNIEKYGYPTWYEWCSNIWGTKWNAFEVKRGKKIISFTTAWNPPIGYLAALAQSGYEFSCKYKTECGETGVIKTDDKTKELIVDVD